jgi:hypothetical protein
MSAKDFATSFTEKCPPDRSEPGGHDFEGRLGARDQPKARARFMVA